MSRQGKWLHSVEKYIIMKVRESFETKREGRSIMRNRVIHCTAKATKIGKTIIKTISKAHKD